MKTTALLFALGFLSLAAAQQNLLALIQTEFGNIKAEIYESKAPVTASNFLRYVDENRYQGATFYRILKPDNPPTALVQIELIEAGLRWRLRRNWSMNPPQEVLT